MSRMKILILGAGRMGMLHAQRLSLRKGLQIQLVDPPRGFRDPGVSPHAAIVATPTSFHARVALPLLEAGIPCLVEKPLASNEKDARLLAGFPHCMPGHIERFNPVIASLPPMDVRFLQAERIAVPTGRAQDVDVVMDLMLHDLDLAACLLSDSIVDIRAVGVSLGRGSAATGAGTGRAGKVDIANVRLETIQGRVANLTASRVSRKTVRSLRLFTPSDYRSLDLLAQTWEYIPWRSGVLDVVERGESKGHALDAEHDAFLATVRGEAAFPVPPRDGLGAVELASRVLAAVHRPRRVDPENVRG